MQKFVAALSVGVLTLSCEAPLTQDTDGWLLASVRGVVARDYAGTGTFYIVRDHPEFHAAMFGLLSEEEGSTGDWVGITGFGQLPSVGRHEVREAASVYEDRSGFTATYHPRSEEWTESYASVDGELTITSSSMDRVEGRFQLTAVRYCRNWLVSGTGNWLAEGSCTPVHLDLNAPSIELTGSFVAVPMPDRPIHDAWAP